MKKIFAVLTIAGLILSCGEKKEEKKGGFEMNRTKKEVKAESASDEVPIDMNNKGVGPIISVEFGAEIDAEMAAKGENTFSTICIYCTIEYLLIKTPPIYQLIIFRSRQVFGAGRIRPRGSKRKDKGKNNHSKDGEVFHWWLHLFR